MSFSLSNQQWPFLQQWVLYEVKSSVNGSVRKVFWTKFIWDHLLPQRQRTVFIIHRSLPCCRKCKAQWLRAMRVVNFRQTPRLEGQGVAHCSIICSPQQPGNQGQMKSLSLLLGMITWHTLHFYCLPWGQSHYPEMWQILCRMCHKHDCFR